MGDHDQQAPIISTASLPDVSQSDANFYDTSFFNGKEGNEPPQLPSPTEVLLKSQETSSGVVIFEDLDLAVKFGPPECVELSEAQAMIAIRRAFPLGNIPVPEVFGWKQREGQNFIYMSLVRGSTLREAWPLLDAADKTAIRDDLRRITTLLRSATHDKFPEIMIAATRQQPGPGGEIKPDPIYREYIPDEGKVVLTHGDLTLGNIIITDGPELRKIAGVIDWEQAGWYPECWEYFKLLYGVEYTHEWRLAGWADSVMTPIEDETLDAISAYFSWR